MDRAKNIEAEWERMPVSRPRNPAAPEAKIHAPEQLPFPPTITSKPNTLYDSPPNPRFISSHKSRARHPTGLLCSHSSAIKPR